MVYFGGFILFMIVACGNGAGSSVNDLIHIPGDVYIGGMFSVQYNNNGRCIGIDVDSVMHVEAVRWTIDKLNSVDFIPGVKIGFIAYKTCGMKELTAVNTNTLVQLNRGGQECTIITDRSNKNETIKIVGIIGPEHRSEVQITSQIMSMLPEEQRIPTIGFSTNYMDLASYKRYPTFLSTLPSDEIQIQVIHDLLKELEWTFVGIIHENDSYNIEYSDRMKHVLQASGICVPVVYQLQTSDERVDVNEIQQVLKNITLKEDPAIRGLIFFGTADVAHVLLLKADDLSVTNKPIFIFPNGLDLKEAIFKDGGQMIGAAKGSSLVMPSKKEVAEFKDYWASVYLENDKLLNQSVVNVWLKNVIEEYSDCQPLFFGSNCNFNLNQQSPYVSYAVEATYALSKTIQQLHKEICRGTKGICHSFRDRHVDDAVKRLKSLEFDITNDLKIYNLFLFNSTFQFESRTGNRMTESTNELFEVYNYQKKSMTSADFHMKRVGTFYNDSLELDKEALKFYDSEGSDVASYPLAQCEPGKICEQCLKADDGMFYIPGDYIVVVAISIRNKETSPFKCSTSIRSAVGLELAYGAIYIAQKFNEKEGVYSKTYPNKTIGVLLVDTCNEPLITQKRLLTLKENAFKRGAPTTVSERIIGFIGDVGSSVTAKFAEITGLLKQVQIGFASTSIIFSDRKRFPYFARVSMPIDKEGEGMVKLVKAMGANYIQIMYSSGEYGEAGRRVVEQFAEKYNICIAQYPMEIAEGSNYHAVLSYLRKKPNAKVVICFLRSHVGPNVLKVINEEMNDGEFIFIGSETWGSRPVYIKNTLKPFGSYAFAQELPKYSGFEEYLRKIVPTPLNENQWILPFFQARLDCYFPWSFDKSMKRKCTKEDTLLRPGDNLDPWTQYVMRATEALLLGADTALKNICGPYGGLCDQYRNNPDIVMDHIMNVRITGVRVFDRNGNGNAGYTIYNIQKDPKDPLKLIYKNVGKLTADGNLQLQNVLLISNSGTSVCPNVQECCPHKNMKITVTTQKYLTRTATTQSIEDNKVVIAMAIVSGVLLLIILTFISIYFCKIKQAGSKKDRDYITAIDMANDPAKMQYESTSGKYSTPAELDKYAEYQQPSPPPTEQHFFKNAGFENGNEEGRATFF